MKCEITGLDCITCEGGQCRLAARAPDVRPYQPTNGTEAEFFMSSWCYRCALLDDDEGDGCRIVAMTMAFSIGDPEYPREWRYGEDGEPMCTAFVADE